MIDGNRHNTGSSRTNTPSVLDALADDIRTVRREEAVFKEVVRQLMIDMDGNEDAVANAIGIRVETLRSWLAK
jgi:hypothetical protein